MNPRKYFEEMYYNIWQSHAVSRLDEFYAKDFEETISVSDVNKQPIHIEMTYDDLAKQAIWQKDNYRNTTFEIKKLVRRIVCGVGCRRIPK